MAVDAGTAAAREGRSDIKILQDSGAHAPDKQGPPSCQTWPDFASSIQTGAIPIPDHHGLSRQRRTTKPAQKRQPLLARGQVVAVQHPHLPAGQARAAAHRCHHRRQPLGTALHQRAQDGRLRVAHLVIQGGQRHRQSSHLSCRRVQRRPQAKANQRHQLDNGGEQQLPRILLPPMRLEHLVNPAGRKSMVQRKPRHYTNRPKP